MKGLFVVDMQNDFANPKGTLYCPETKQVIPNIVDLIKKGEYRLILVSTDAHPDNHCSFETWPKHCVEGTWGYDLVSEVEAALLDTTHRTVIVLVRKGFCSEQECYSAMKGDQNIVELLDKFGIKSLDICGVAMEYCVKSTALDALEAVQDYGITVTLRCNSIAAVDGGKNSKLISEFMDEFEQKGGKTDS